MKKQQIQDLFNQRYNQAKWKQFLGETFANVQLLATPENLTGIDHHVATNAQKLGYILLNEDGIDRQIAVYEVTLAQGIILERNRVGLRNLLRKYWKNIDGAFIVYHHPESVNWRFTYVSELTGYDAEGEFIQIKTEPKRYTYILGEGESIRTAGERFEQIINKGNKVSLEDVKEAFSVEKLSKTFFEKYKEHYNNFCEYIISQPGISQTIFNGDKKAIRDFSKKLLGRIVFLYFIQKKGWLGVPENEDWGNGDHHFLTNQFQNFTDKELFYKYFLSVLFFDTLNTKRANDLFIENPSYKIPYLNGGLFEEENPNHRNLIFPDHLFANLFNVFDQYNFTIYEDDPLDHTIAVDPEMLGHIFENLLEDNKDKGAYYTPKEIVHYMCQESLIEYLNTYCLNCDFSDLGITLIEENQKELITQFIKKKEINIDILEKSSKSKESYKSWFRHLNIALDKVKICDPAIGSGAFPMGLLHEIFTAKQTLHTFEFGNTTNFNASDVKLNIIQNSIYGVDIERGAVDIARLRFWLSLIVDEDKPKALPNLDYKIVVGNSLVSKFGDDIIDIDWEIKDVTQGSILVDVYQPQEILRKISDKQKEFFSPDSDKKKLAADIRDLKIDLLISQLELMIKTKGMEDKPTGKGKTLTKQTEIYLQTVGWKQNIKELKQLKNNPDKSLNFFDWKLDFPEVMNQQLVENVGFDIVIGNPPFLNFKMYSSEEREVLKLTYPAIFDGKADIYYYFFICAVELAKSNAFITFITSRYWLEAEFASKLRKYLAENVTFTEIVDFKNITVFDGIGIKTGITSFKNNKTAAYTFFYRDHSGKKIEIVNLDEFQSLEIPKANIDKINWVLKDQKGSFLIQKIESNTILLSDIAHCKQGIITGRDSAFIIEDYLIKNFPKELLKKWLKVGDIHKFYINQVKERYLIYTKSIENLDDFPNIKSHFLKYIDKLENRTEVKKGNLRWFDLHRTREPKLFNSEKLICRFKASENTFCYDNNSFYSSADTTIVCLKVDVKDYSLKYLLALLNSKVLDYYFKSYGKLMDYRFEYYPTPVGNMRIKKAPNQEKFIKLVDNILLYKTQGKDTTALEQQIDNMVYKLYELSYKEVKIIDPEFTLTEKEYADIKIDR
ncbi:Eco57I restriction-modification methylase domain-containing protein [Dolichospermum compactum]|uniref:site-specific DNA-methyltransferase (adenine-specific) n=1 Tax=Dolichospermum compactum NIES-806 TaxID=1973481 RepID=A0A1Z4V2V6_9CYAN|nr:Eco57I restriction-modification methylase domain-containing protein [Dolichospermum compactum]BAZ85856.1 hypothetical protein NIES806_20600 [Dolichospermum compactum NIES-806]